MTDRPSDRHRPAAAAAAAAALTALAVLGGCGSSHSAAHVKSVSAASSASSDRSAGLSSGDRNWLAEIHQANLAEEQAGTLAAEKARSAAVRSAGEMMASQHEAFDEKIIGTAGKLHVPLPDYLTLSDSQAADRLATEMGSVYDHDFTATMMTSHQQVISDTQNENSHGSAPVVTGLARQALPMLRQHLAALQSAASAP